jgi:protein O-GlcNAc transferase
MQNPSVSLGAGPLAEAVSLHERGKLNPARKLYKEALSKQPTNVAALERYGTLLVETGDHAEAVRIFGQAAELNPRSLIAHFNRGMSLKVLKRFAEAEASLQAAVALDADRAFIHLALGEAIFEQNRVPDAIPHYQQAAVLDAGLVNAHMNLGQAFTRLGRHEEAVTSFSKAVTLTPDAEDASIELGKALATVGRRHDAYDVFRRNAEIHPGSHLALRHHAAILRDLGHDEPAHDMFERALALKPDALDVMLDLMRLKRILVRWDGLEKLEKKALQLARRQDAPLNMVHLLWIEDDPILHRRVAAKFPHVHDIPEDFPAFQPAKRGEKIRIGYFSADFREHPVGHAVCGLFAAHDRNRFEMHGFSLAPGDGSPIRQRLDASVDRMHDVAALDSAEIIDVARKANLDIAVDLNGYTLAGRTTLFRARVAPVQVNAVGYPGTLELPGMDYVLADCFVIPPGAEQNFAEKIVRLPDCYLPNDLRSFAVPAAPSRASQGLPDTGFVFGGFNDGRKIGPELFSCWMRVLKRVDGSVLWLSDRPEHVRLRIRGEAEAQGIDGARILFAPFEQSRAEHMARQRLIDLMLDTSPYNAHTTASDALWSGVPVVTIAGRAFPSRVAGSTLRAAGLQDLVAESIHGYETLACAVAQTPSHAAALRQRLAEQRGVSGLFDLPRYVSHLEEAYRQMSELASGGYPPQSFDVEAREPVKPM